MGSRLTWEKRNALEAARKNLIQSRRTYLYSDIEEPKMTEYENRKEIVRLKQLQRENGYRILAGLKHDSPECVEERRLKIIALERK